MDNRLLTYHIATCWNVWCFATVLIGMKDGRLPEGASTRIGFWKAEEIQKFAYPPSQLVFGDVLSDEEYDL